MLTQIIPQQQKQFVAPIVKSDFKSNAAVPILNFGSNFYSKGKFGYSLSFTNASTSGAAEQYSSAHYSGYVLANIPDSALGGKIFPFYAFNDSGASYFNLHSRGDALASAKGVNFGIKYNFDNKNYLVGGVNYKLSSESNNKDFKVAIPENLAQDLYFIEPESRQYFEEAFARFESRTTKLNLPVINGNLAFGRDLANFGINSENNLSGEVGVQALAYNDKSIKFNPYLSAQTLIKTEVGKFSAGVTIQGNYSYTSLSQGEIVNAIERSQDDYFKRSKYSRAFAEKTFNEEADKYFNGETLTAFNTGNVPYSTPEQMADAASQGLSVNKKLLAALGLNLRYESPEIVNSGITAFAGVSVNNISLGQKAGSFSIEGFVSAIEGYKPYDPDNPRTVPNLPFQNLQLSTNTQEPAIVLEVGINYSIPSSSLKNNTRNCPKFK